MPATLYFDRASAEDHTYRTTWGEQYRIRAGGSLNDASCSVLDYSAPPGFGVVRHTHFEQEENLYILAGEVAVWTPMATFVLKAGDSTSLPPGVPHAWRSIGDVPVRMLVTMPQGPFEQFFPMLQERRLTMDDKEALAEVAALAGMQVAGPALSDAELQQILADAE